MWRYLLAALLAATAATAATGCNKDSTSRARLTPAELGWVRAYSAWTFAVSYDELRPYGQAAVRTCRQRLEVVVGAPPSDRLRPAADRAAGVCPLLSELGSKRRAVDMLETADDALIPLLLDSRELPLSTGSTPGSRADLRFSAFASVVVGRPLEVRCWSPDDWRAVVYEGNAWTDSSRDPNETNGMADTDRDRIHIRIGECNTLVRLIRGDVLPAGHGARLQAADSLATIAHEVQHFVLPEADEAEVECAGRASLERVAARLGIDGGVASELAALYGREIYPEQPDEYIKGGC